MSIKRAVVLAKDLVRAYFRHLKWKCIGCGAVLKLEPEDERVGTGQCPRCERCGDLTCAIGDPPKEPS